MINHINRTSLFPIIPCLLGAVLILGCKPPPPPELQQATILSPAKPLAGFQLSNQKGETFTLDDLKGYWTFTFFGYTHCPDVCPTALSMMAQVIRKLENKPDPDTLPRGLFVSVDPQRDTPEVLAKYLPYFHPDFIGATGDITQINTLTRQLGILHARSENSGNDDSYLVDHSAAIILFDPEGNYHALFNVPHAPDKIASDFAQIKAYYEARR